MSDDTWERWLKSDPACWSWPMLEHRPLDDVMEHLATRRPSMRRSLEASQRFSDFHAGRCAICGDPCNNPAEDHCHRTGLVRGYLCRGCNSQEGIHRSSASIYGRYRERPPTVILGHAEQYFGGWGCEDGAEPVEWIVELLGPVPRDPGEAAAYLAAAARQDVTDLRRRDNPLRKMGL